MCFRYKICEVECFNALDPYSLTWIKMNEKSAQDQIRIKENSSADLWLKSVFTKEGSAEPKNWKNCTQQRTSSLLSYIVNSLFMQKNF